jgi:hypothetical protein
MKKSNAIAAWTFVLLLVTLASIHVQAKVHSGTSLTPQKQKAATKTAKSYACPMHPEVKSNKPGAKWICDWLVNPRARCKP